jgi:hypothetical protein
MPCGCSDTWFQSRHPGPSLSSRTPTLPPPAACFRLLSYRVTSSLSHRPFPRTQSPAGRLHRYIKQRTQESVRAGAKAADYLGSGFEISLRGALELALVKVAIGGYTTHLQVPCHRTSTGFDRRDTGTIIRAHAKQIGGSPTQDPRLKVKPNPDERKQIKKMIQFKRRTVE